jgi:hypothetical protein
MQGMNRPSINLSLKITAGYFICVALFGLSLLIMDFVRYTPELARKSIEWKVGNYTRETVLNVLLIISGVGILRSRAWARKLGITTLVICTFYGAHAFAWAFADGTPSLRIFVFGFAVVGAWNAMWIYLLCRKPPKAPEADSQQRGHNS